MFEKSDEMRTAKHAGSPAFLPPELCVAKHGDVSGRAADVWSMGVTLYCLRYGKLPFEKINVLDMYESIRNDEPEFPPDEDPDFLDLMHRLLEKDPEKRIQIPELRVSWKLGSPSRGARNRFKIGIPLWAVSRQSSGS